LSVDPVVDQTGQPYVFTNDNPLNATDPLGLKGWYCINGKSHYYKGDKYGPATGKCGSEKDEKAVDAAVKAYVRVAGSNGHTSYVQLCGSVFITLCVSVTTSGQVYGSAGVNVGLPGVTASVDQSNASSSNQALSGSSTCIEGGDTVGGVKCWNNDNSNTSTGVEFTPGTPTAGVSLTDSHHLFGF
jgi:hypothetical protein